MMRRFKLVIIFSLLLTLPIVIPYSLIVKNSLLRNIEMDKFSVSGRNKVDIYNIAVSEYMDMKSTILYYLGFSIKTDANILISKEKSNALLENLPTSAFIDKESLLIHKGKLYKGKARLRGDNFYHWNFPQASWRFKLSKNNLIDGVRKFNFIIPKSNVLVVNHYAYLLAEKMGILSPKSEMLTLGINGIYNGMKLQVEQIDENFLRNNKRMPSDIYKGDLAGSKRILGVKANIFTMASIWDKSSYNNHYQKNNYYPLSRLFKELKNDQYSLYDLNEFSKFSNYIDMTGSRHHDYYHNWVLSYDNYLERFSPIVWDTGEWRAESRSSLITAPLLSSLYKNYDFIKLKYHNFRSFSVESRDEFFKNAVFDKNRIKSKIGITNVGSFNLFRDYMKTDIVLTKLDEFFEFIKNKVIKIEDEFLGTVEINDYSYVAEDGAIRLSVKGKKLINAISIESLNRINVKNVSISYLLNGKYIDKKVSFMQNNNVVSIPIELLSNVNISLKEGEEIVEYNEATYDVKIKGLNKENIKEVKLNFLSLEKQSVHVEAVDFISEKSFNNVHNVVSNYVDSTPMTWAGEKTFTGFNLITNNVIIKPGTNIIFEEGATLKVLGKVTAIGTKDNPITFEAKDKTKPWGAFALKDSKANDSIFKHCIFRDGSGDKGDLHEYTAMFSVHNVQNLLVEDCEFYDSHKTDDMVHLVYSDAVFKNTKFIRSLSDALDVDISNVVVDNCEFVESGNDSIDLMTSNAIVINSKFIKSADKAISIGEGSNLLAIRNMIKNSEIGMQSKDTSKAYIYDTTFIGNKKAVDAYHKNWRYSEGGTITLDNTVFENNIINATVGKKSKVIINNSTIDTPDNFDVKSIEKGKIVLSHGGTIIPDFDLDFFKEVSASVYDEVVSVSHE
jgi:hypothetical protein